MTISISTKKPVDITAPSFLAMKSALQGIANKDFTLWGKAAEGETSIRLDWVNLPITSQELLPQLDALKDFLASNELTDILLCGMGGSSLGPEVLAKTYGKHLTCIDTTDPDQLRHSTPANLKNTAIIVGSKSGGTAETASQKAYFEELLKSHNLDPKNHFIIVTDPGSPFDQECRSKEYFVINANPNVGGRFSVLSAFGLVPAAAIGIDVRSMLSTAAQTQGSFIKDDSPALTLAASIYQAQNQILSLSDAGTSTPGLADWIEQLIAESTGKEGVGFLPIALPRSDSPAAGDGLRISFTPSVDADIVVEADIAEQFIVWEWATALLGIPMQINIFDQPNVQEAKTRAIALLSEWGSSIPDITPDSIFGNVEIFGASGESLRSVLREFFRGTERYAAIMAYLSRGIDDEILRAQELVSLLTKKPTSFGWGPRFLHSTGQFHKGGQPNGTFLVITGESCEDIAIPGKPYSFHTLLMAQSIGDFNALRDKNLRAIRLHLTDRKTGIQEILQALKQ